MDPTLEEKQNDQTQKEQLGGGINRGINTINKLARGGLKNPLGKVGQRIVVQTVLRGFAAFLAGPGLPIVIAIASVLVFTFIIVGFGGAPPSEINNQSTNPTITPIPEP